MFRLIVLCLCASLIWAIPAKPGHPNRVPLKSLKPRIINGNPAEEGQIPYQAGIFFEAFLESWFCGGTIISEEWILTAGHCVDGALLAQVVTGTTDVYTGVVTDAYTFVLHEDYNGTIIASDVGLVQLSQPLTFDANTAAIALASDPLDVGVDIRVSGWGYTSDNDFYIAEILSYVNLVTISNDDCESYYGAGSILPEVVCATSPTDDVKSTCSGDSGGPVVINVDSTPTQAAIVSFVSDEGCESGAPSGYTRTAPFRNWVTEKTGV